MKKILSSLCVGAMAISAMAQTTYVVYSDQPLSTGQEQIPTNFYIWEGTCGVESDLYKTPATFTLGNAGWAGGGWVSMPQFDFTAISGSDYELVIELKSEDAFKFSIQYNNQTKGVASGDTEFGFTHNGEWQTIRVDLKSRFPKVTESIEKGNEIYVPGVVFNDFTPGAKMEIRSIRLEPVVKEVAPAGKTFYGTKALSITNNVSGIVAANLNYKFVTNENGTVTIFWGYTNLDKIIGHVEDEIQIGNNFPVGTKIEEGEYTYSYTTEQTYFAGEAIDVVFRLKQAGPMEETRVSYTVGAENEKPLPVPSLLAYASEVTSEGATITYEVLLPAALEGADVKVYNGEEAIATPYVITGLNDNTDYTYTLIAVATLDGTEYKSAPATVTFRTIRKDAQEKSVTGKLKGVATNVMVAADKKEDIAYTIDYTVTFTVDNKIRVDMTVDSEKEIVGLVPQLMINGGYSGNFQAATRASSWTYTTPSTYTEGEVLPLNIFFAYAGGAANNEFSYTVGETGTVSVEGIAAEATTVDVYTLSGIRVRSNVQASEAFEGLPAGIYIAGGKKVVVK